MDKSKLIIVVGYPKSGNTWLSRLLGDILDSPVRGYMNARPIATEGSDRIGDYTIMQLHMRITNDSYSDSMPNAWRFCAPNWNGEKIVHIIRDPRDVAVSIKFYWNIETLRAAILAMAEGDNPLRVHGKWDKFISDWLSARFPVKTTFYESLHNDTKFHIISILNALNVSLPQDEHINSAIERQCFNTRRADIEANGENLMYGRNIQLKNMRKGIVGDWKNHFNRADGMLLDEYFWTTMLNLGYEKELHWWANLPDKSRS